jgi:hypothetical protein
MMDNNNNILLKQIKIDSSSFSFKEIIPNYTYTDLDQMLTKDKDGNIFWVGLDLSLNLIVNNKFKETDIYYADGRIGIGRYPLYNYKIDVAVPKDTVITAFHIGDGSFGFSMGNGTLNGFIPEIIGIGSDENDTGLYFVGIAGNNKSSNIPLIILDGRNTYNAKLTNRPILGITSANYDEYSVLIDAFDNLNVKGNISASDIVFNNISLIKIINEIQEQLSNLKTKIT